jgi:heme/copper-type cytochrome/quinol oxidase subunit 4
MEIIKILITYLLGFTLSVLLFALSFVASNKIKKEKLKYVFPFLMPIVAIVPTLIVLTKIDMKDRVFNISAITDGVCWSVLLITVLVVAFLISMKSKRTKMTSKEILANGLSGMTMEIPQRLLMQTLLYMLLKLWEVSNAGFLSYLLNAFVWCTGIIVQALLDREAFNKDLFLDVFASFLFSIGIGYVFMRSGLIILPLIAHFMERIVSKTIINYRISTAKNI